MKIAIVAPAWGRETTSDQTYLSALARALAERHSVRLLTLPEPPANPCSRPGPLSNPGLAAPLSNAGLAAPVSNPGLAAPTATPGLPAPGPLLDPVVPASRASRSAPEATAPEARPELRAPTPGVTKPASNLGLTAPLAHPAPAMSWPAPEGAPRGGSTPASSGALPALATPASDGALPAQPTPAPDGALPAIASPADVSCARDARNPAWTKSQSAVPAAPGAPASSLASAGPAGRGASRNGAHAARPAGPAVHPRAPAPPLVLDLTVERTLPHALDRLPDWLAASALGRPLMGWAFAPAVDELIAWADTVLVPTAAGPLAQAAAHRAHVLGKLALVPAHGDAADRALARTATAIFTGTRSGARALLASGWPADRIAVTGLTPESTGPADPALFRRRYRVSGPFILYDGAVGDAAYELIRNAVGLVWHKRPEATFVFVAPSRGGRRCTRTSHAGHMLHLSGMDEAERASAFAAAALVCAAGPLAPSGATVADAWLRARPVVATDSPVARELLADGGAGCLAVADAHELATAMLRLLTDPARADRLGTEGLRRLRESHAPARLHELLAERLAPARPLDRARPPTFAPWQRPEPRVSEARAR